MNSDFRLAVNFASHPKLVKLRRRLGDGAAFGWVCLLGHVAANKSHGRLNGMDAEDIAIAAQYAGDSFEFVNVMVELRLLDRDGEDLVIHDWEQRNPWAAKEQERGELARRGAQKRWAGTTPEQRVQEMRRVRAAESSTCSSTSTDVPATCSSTSATCDSTCSSPLLSSPSLTSRDPTRNQISEEKRVCTVNKVGAVGALPLSLVSSNGAPRSDGFDEFWDAYPLKRAKKDAQAAWRKLKPDPTMRQRILADLPRFRDQSSFNPIPYPATYLNGRRWEDQATTSVQTVSAPYHRSAREILKQQLEGA